MIRRAQGALEYLLMVAVVLILVAIVIQVVLPALKETKTNLDNYATHVRRKILENL
ncbi:class III signal peptide-containing protein [Thermococcus stetteri]|uniref:class III signal peptide-containing protein n=1 Tax=Thermococcus stetteri TaxID=49900 RepID=UPI001FD77927|nr:class III signal peptide-containing protein [Thermococcus stetteri]MBP1910949.1 uncharacterized protein (UPF0333 family) [Thermococcus stetteri]